MEPEQSSETELSGPLPLAIPAGAEESVVAKQELRRKLEAEDLDKAEWRVPAELVVEVRSALLTCLEMTNVQSSEMEPVQSSEMELSARWGQGRGTTTNLYVPSHWPVQRRTCTKP